MNVLLLTVDDLNYNSLGYTGCQIKDISPNLDKLASESVYFENAHVTIAVCQPSRSVMMTGRYPHRNGALGFDPIDTTTQTITEQTHKHGFLNGIIGKEIHLAPKEKFCWDFYKNTNQTEIRVAGELIDNNSSLGRDPNTYYNYTKEFLAMASTQNKPFLLMANSHDPHRPFALSCEEFNHFGKHTKVSRIIKEDEVSVPNFLPDLPEIKKEIAEYYTSVHRGDESIGAILKALKESGQEENTIVIFLSDNGMAFPFAKTNCYLNSTKTPLLVKWPGHTKAGTVNSKDMVSGIDLTPTILDMLGLPPLLDIDGKSFTDTLNGKPSEEFNEVFTVFNTTSAKREYPMRCIVDSEYGYILNLWHDGETRFKNESQAGLTFNAMAQASINDDVVKQRTEFFEFRVPEELYNIKTDPDSLHNLADDTSYNHIINKMRDSLISYMETTCDFMTQQAVDFIENKRSTV